MDFKENKYYKRIEYDRKGKIFDFECYSIDDIERDFGNKLKWRIGKFIDLVFRKVNYKIRFENRDWLSRNGFVYVSKKDIEGILGKYWSDILKDLSKKKKILKVRRLGNSVYDFNKKYWWIGFGNKWNYRNNSNKKWVEIDNGILNRFLDKRNNVVRKKLGYDLKLKDIVNEESKELKKGIIRDRLLLYEIRCCINSDLIIENLDNVIDNRIKNKIEEWSDRSSWIWNSRKKSDKIVEEVFSDLKSWKEERKFEYKNKYEVIKSDLEKLRNWNVGDLSEDYFKRDEFGGRLYNFYSRVIREFREYILLDNEEVVELDIKSCMVSLFFKLVRDLNNDINDDGLIKLVKNRLNDLYKERGYLDISDRNGKDFLEKYKNVFELDGVFWNEENEIEFDNYYDSIKEKFGLDVFRSMSKNCFKDLCWVILFSGRKKLRGLNVNGINVKEIERIMFGYSGRNLVNDLKEINVYELFKWKGIGRSRNYDRSKNISLILMNMENRLMDIMRNVLIKNGYMFISMFDSFIVKKSESKIILELLNENLSYIDRVLKFKDKSKVIDWEYGIK